MSRPLPLLFFFLPSVRVRLMRDVHGRYSIELGHRRAGASRAIMAMDSAGRTVAVLAFSVIGRRFESHMTYVADAHRGAGIARELWDLALSRVRVARVVVTVISDNGLALMRDVAQRHPAVRFDVREGGGRKLRDKRRAA